MKNTLDARIRDLEDQLKKERENMEGSAKEREAALKKEIEEWKKKFNAKESENEDLKSQIK
jgi:predicted  nucleic acid-binding Zn-ribbon protein